MDISLRLGDAGFLVEIIRTADCDPALISLYSLSHIATNEIFVCRKFGDSALRASRLLCLDSMS